MLVVTTENVAHHRVVEVKGQCFGVVVRSRGIGGNIMAGLRSIVGGEIHEYTQLLEEARRHAVDRLVQNVANTKENVRRRPILVTIIIRPDIASCGRNSKQRTRSDVCSRHGLGTPRPRRSASRTASARPSGAQTGDNSARHLSGR